jgi:hypothetical protein
MFEIPLNDLEQRVLGCLMEKQLSTPEYYPLTLNALVNACNQSTNRDPVMHVDPPSVELALEELKNRGLTWTVSTPGSRAIKFEHRVTDTFSLSLQEAAVLAELLLRGPQTPGELRSRCTRMYAFQDLVEIDAALKLLAEAEPSLAEALPRVPGTKETRWAQLLGARPETLEIQPTPRPTSGPSPMQRLEAELAALKEEVSALREDFQTFKKQFD